MDRYLFLFDLHFGWEKYMTRGEWKTKPTHNLKAVKAVMEFAKDFKPNIVLLGGDQLNCGPISHWRDGKPILNEGFRLKDEMLLLDKHILTPFEAMKSVQRKIWIEGNHEAWIDDHVSKHSGLEGIVEPRNWLRLAERNWEIYSPGEIAKIGKLHVIHGDKFFKSFRGIGPRTPAAKLVNAYRRNIRAGHLHTLDMATEVTPTDIQDYHTGAIVPAMCAKNNAYAFNSPSATITGFEYGYMDPKSGDFSDYIVVINKNKFTTEGKSYDGNK